MHEIKGKIRYSETDSTGRLTYPALLNYFQDSSFSHSEGLGVGWKYLKELNLAWVLSSWQICINEMPQVEDEVVTQTWPYEFKGFYGYRNFTMVKPGGQRYAYANSLWVLIDINSGRPVRVPQEVSGAYTNEPPIEMECSDRKIAIPAVYEEKDPITVLKYFIDTNQHMNNEKYVMIAQEFLPDDFVIGEIRVEYRKSAVLNDVLYPRVSVETGYITVVLADEDGKPYATVLFIKKTDKQ